MTALLLTGRPMEHITELTHCGFRVAVRTRTPHQDLNVLTEVIGNDSYGLGELKDCLRPKTILDIGGHIGAFGLLVKHLWPEVLLVAVEPSKDNAYLYSRNMELNGYGAEVVNAGVQYNCECNCLLYAASTTGGYVMRTPQEAEKYVAEGYRFYDHILHDHVTVVTIGMLSEMFGVERWDLVKWDCEGCEVDAFENMPPEDVERLGLMVGEYHIWSERCRYLKPDVVDCFNFWKKVKRRFPHLNRRYKNNCLGLFQTWLKGDDNGHNHA